MRALTTLLVLSLLSGAELAASPPQQLQLAPQRPDEAPEAAVDGARGDDAVPEWARPAVRNAAVQIFFLAIPSTASTTVGHAAQSMSRLAAVGPAASAAAPSHSLAQCAHNGSYRGKFHVDLGFQVRTFRDLRWRRRTGGATDRDPAARAATTAALATIQGVLLVGSPRQRVAVVTMLRRPRPWLCSLVARFWAFPHPERSAAALAAWADSAHGLWNAQTRFIAGNFTSFEAELVNARQGRNGFIAARLGRGGGRGSNGGAGAGAGDGDGEVRHDEEARVAAHEAWPTRAQAESWSKPESGLLARAIATLERHVAFFGLSERVDDSIFLLRRTLCWPQPAPTTVASGQRRSRGEAAAAGWSRDGGGDGDATAAERRIGAHFALDEQMYQHASQLFDRRLLVVKSSIH